MDMLTWYPLTGSGTVHWSDSASLLADASIYLTFLVLVSSNLLSPLT